MKSFRLILYIFHFIVLIIFGVQHNRVDLKFSNYVDLFGWDETYWISESHCDWYDEVLSCLLNSISIYPVLLKTMISLSDFVYVFSLTKALFFCLAVYFLVNGMKKQDYKNTRLFEAFLLLNPYVILLHLSTMRDDLIAALVLLICGLYLRFGNRPKLTIIILCYFSVLILFGFRLGYGIILLLLTSLILSKSLSKLFLGIFVFTAYLLIDLITNILPDTERSLLAILNNLRELFFSPAPWNVINGTTQAIGGETANLPIYSLIYPFFSIVSLTIFIYLYLINKNTVIRHYKKSFLLLIVSVCLIIPYAISTRDVAGPRQSLPATLLLFYVIGIPVIASLTKLVSNNKNKKM